MFLTYPAIFIKDGESFHIQFPDFPEIRMVTATNVNVVKIASGSLENHIIDLMINNKEIPVPTSFDAIKQEKDSILVMLQVNLPEFNHKYVKKTLTIPVWLNDLAIKYNLNFSRILTEALVERFFAITGENYDRK